MCTYCDTFGGDRLWYLNPQAHAWRIYRVKERVNPNATITTASVGEVDWEPITEIIPLQETDPEKYQEKLDKFSEHIGSMSKLQVVPLQDIEKMLEVCGIVTSLNCVCRFFYRGWIQESQDEFYCGGLGPSMLRWERWPERYKGCRDVGGIKFMSIDEAKEWIRNINKKGFVHCVGHEVGSVNMLCNCNYPECMIMRYRIDYGVQGALLKAHYVAMVDWDKCTGCCSCTHRCYFGSLRFNPNWDRVEIDPHTCFGCGLCETTCPEEAIRLERRENFPGLKDNW